MQQWLAVGICTLVVNSANVLRYRLHNGLNVLMAPNRAAPVAALQAWVGVGAADETPAMRGVAHAFEHMLFKGTRSRGVGDIAKDVEAAGGEINAWTSFDQTVYHVVLASRYFDQVLDVLADALLHSTFDSDELARERAVIIEEIRKGLDDPSRYVMQTLFRTAYTRHPYGQPVIGTIDTVQALSRARLLEFFRTWYVANNATLVVTGDIDPEIALVRIEKVFGNMRSGRVVRRRRREPRQTRPRVQVVSQDVHDAQFALGFHVPPLCHPDTPALDALAVALGQGRSSRLATVLRRAEPLVSSVSAYVHSQREPGLFVVGATLAPTDVSRAVYVALREVFRTTVEPLDAVEIDKARKIIEADSIYQGETTQGLARKYGYYELVAGDASYESQYIDAVRALTPADIRASSARHLTLENLTVVALLPSTGHLRSSRGRAAKQRRLLAVANRAARGVPVFGKRAPARRGDIAKLVMSSGLRVLVKQESCVPMVAMRAVWVGGVRTETRSNNGINHILASLLTRGCGELSANDVAVAVDDMAGVLSGFSGRNSFGVRSEWLSEDWERGFDLMATCILEPTLSYDELVNERRRVYDELAIRAQTPRYLVFRAFAEALYRKHPYRRDILGTTTSVGKLTRKHLVDYYRRMYPPGAMTLVVVGDVEPAGVLARAHRRFGAVKRVAQRVSKKVPPEDFFAGRTEPTIVFRHLVRQQAHVVVGFPGTTVDDPDRYALEVLTAVLSGQGGRLFIELRDTQGLTYQVGAFSVEGIDPGYLAVYIACSPDQLDAVYAGIRVELDRLVTTPIAANELARAQRYLVGTHEISLQQRSATAAALAFHDAYGIGLDEYDRYAAAIGEVTSEAVKRAAAEYINWDVAVISTVKSPDVMPTAARRVRGTNQRRGRARSDLK